MARLSKRLLLSIFEQSLSLSGVDFLRLSDVREHPALYNIGDPNSRSYVKVYIWNLTFGGRPQLPDEWRIQVTGLDSSSGAQHFVPEVSGKTLILGWCSELEVFAGYDVNRHLGPLGGSPSIQIRQPALEAARIDGLAHHLRGEDEIAFAIRPDHMGAYVQFVSEFHDCATSPAATRILASLCADPVGVSEASIRQQVPEARQFALISTRQALRDSSFKLRVLTAYANSCAMCGIQLRLLDAAHILPAADPRSSDDTSNGIALCALHHRAFDRGLVTFDCSYRIHSNEDMQRQFKEQGVDFGLDRFKKDLFPMIKVPPERRDRPDPECVQTVNGMRGWSII